MQETVMGMVLSAFPIGEYDKRLIILTKEYGKITAFAKGARRQSSSLLACTAPFTFGEFTVYRGRSSTTMYSARVENYFEELRNDLDRLYYGMYFLEVADYFTKEGMDTKEELKLLYQSLRALCVPSLSYSFVRYIFELKMLTIEGVAPNVFTCKECGGKEKLRWFRPEEAGIYCEKHKPLGQCYKVSDAALYALQHVILSTIQKLYTFTLPHEAMEEFSAAIGSYWHFNVNGEFHSLEMLTL